MVVTFMVLEVQFKEKKSIAQTVGKKTGSENCGSRRSERLEQSQVCT
jgi:hypothetical protein